MFDDKESKNLLAGLCFSYSNKLIQKSSDFSDLTCLSNAYPW